MNDTPDPTDPERPDKRFWRRPTPHEWVEIAIYVFFGLIALLAGIGWVLGRD
ncbi:hypothetical protein [Glycomyces paridis]|uniref:hypothetical protein n=1 Tax=Glycomyces paridis TaxID=2126555 RepID=UPI0013051E22|nr:hypothetical protein [Glycomyces paridis]